MSDIKKFLASSSLDIIFSSQMTHYFSQTIKHLALPLDSLGIQAEADFKLL